jgi:FtsZ-binding cell division protein ZapB
VICPECGVDHAITTSVCPVGLPQVPSVVGLLAAVGCNSCSRLWSEVQELTASIGTLHLEVEELTHDNSQLKLKALADQEYIADLRERLENQANDLRMVRAAIRQGDVLRLRAALRPFAERAKLVVADWDDEAVTVVPVGLLRAALKALEEQP